MKKNTRGEMPFLDHLEELRWRILWSLIALVAGSAIGFYVVQHFEVLDVLKQPIEPYLPEGRLFITRPTDAFIITLKLAVAIGLVLASPIIVAQVWRFLSPALYEHERRYIVPALMAGFGLFVSGIAMAYLWVLPAVFRILHGFQYGDLEWIITADAYFSLATQLVLAFGIMFQLPLVMVLLSALGLVEPKTFAKQRPIALVIGCVVAALLTPPDAISMLMMLGPLLFLYEGGLLAARLVRRRPRKTIGGAMIVLALATGFPGASDAQEPAVRRPPRDSVVTVRDSTLRDSTGVPLDTAAARLLGLPTAPSRSLPQADSIIQRLLGLEGYAVTRYAGDSITLYGASREIVLVGEALVEQEGSILEADTVRFLEEQCLLLADGSPALFDGGTVLVGEDMRYDTCARVGRIPAALTSVEQGGVTWYVRGALEIDSASTRVYGGSNEFTSCQQPTPHYHFSTSSVKWVTNTIMVARPAVLYVRDVPVLWLPFIFQDIRPGRHSGILVPRFGFSDLVRPNEGYRRHVSNIGYYLALSDYLDLQASLDWFSGNYVGVNGQLRYRWLDRFLQGGLAVSRIFEEGVEGAPGSSSLRLQWNHRQSFNQRTTLTADVDFATSTRVIERNSVDPFVQTATLASRINFNKQFDWGTLSLGGNRSQDLSNGTTSQTLPSLALTPSPIALASFVTWSPSLSVTNQHTFDQGPGYLVPRPPVDGIPQADTVLFDTRTTNVRANTPIRIGRWNWTNSFSVVDSRSNRRDSLVLPDPLDPTDSVVRFYGEDFSTAIDWTTGINLPILLASTWKLQPSVGIANTTGGAFLLRNRRTGGGFVSQGKRLSFSLSSAPTLFGFFPGVGPIARIRHAISPFVTWQYAPPASVPEAYARASDPSGRNPVRESPAQQRITFGLSQTFEGKFRLAPNDTTTDPSEARKIKLLSIQTSSVTYDFEQAKLEGRTGWATQTLSNSFTSDLLPGFTLSTTHDLWAGRAGYDTTRFDPFLQNISARFSISANTVRSIAALVGLGAAPPPAGEEQQAVDREDAIQPIGTATGPPTRLDPRLDAVPTMRGGGGGAGFRADITYDDRRTRPSGEEETDTFNRTPSTNRSLGFAVRFSPTESWSVSWNTQYNLTTHEFGQHVLRLDRDLHRWRATFAFLRAPNGNFAFNFFISLTDQPEIKFQYDQRTVRQGGEGVRQGQ